MDVVVVERKTPAEQDPRWRAVLGRDATADDAFVSRHDAHSVQARRQGHGDPLRRRRLLIGRDPRRPEQEGHLRDLARGRSGILARLKLK